MALSPLLLLALAAAAPDASQLKTVADQSAYARTGRYEEVLRLCRDYPRAFPGRVRCDTFGVTPEGRNMVAFVAGEPGTLTPEGARARGRPVLMFQGGIHAGEIDGKDAGFLFLRELLTGAAHPGALQRATLVFVPVLNVDGHERFGPNQRPNQRGPEETGWRATAQNLNLNRDYVKADAPEMRALLALLGAWDPLVYVDLHATDGAQFEHDIAVMVEPVAPGGPGEDTGLAAQGRALRDALMAGLTHQGHLPLPFYPSFRKGDDPASGFALNVAQPRFSQAYWRARGRFGVLVETHSWRPYPERVKSTRNTLSLTLAHVLAHGDAMARAVAAAEKAADDGAGRTVTLTWESTGESRPLAFRGYAYVREPSPLTGKPWVRYDETKPQVWNIPYYEAVRPALRVALPRGGWVVPVASAGAVAERLRLHGVRFRLLPRGLPEGEVQRFRADEVRPSAQSFEGRQPLRVKGEWVRARAGAPAGSLFVPAAQPRAELAAHLLEPLGPDSLLAWGLFNAHFEQKEYVEDYVVEAWAREALRKDAGLKRAWEERLKDPAFAQDPDARLRFLAQRHPALDVAYQRYPVLRTDAAPR